METKESLIKKIGIIDCHTHTNFSHDSKCDPKDSYNSAKEKGLLGYCVTDHCDVEFCESTDIITPVVGSVKSAKSFGGYALAGVEMGESLWHTDAASEVLKSAEYDIVLGSVHAVRYEGYTIPFAQIDFSDFTEKQINEFMSAYFTDMLETIDKCDFDVLTHLTLPLRYITGKYGKFVDLTLFSAFTDEILKRIIEKDRALEVNTSCLGSSYNELLPEKSLIARFKELGGYLITIGSDAHSADRIAYGFEETVLLLKELGFDNLYYYKNRTPIAYKL